MTVSRQESVPVGGEYTIRPYLPADEDGVIGLLRLSLGEGSSFARDAEFWRWKHFRNPFGASQLLLAAGEEVWGLRAFMRWAFRTPSGSVRAVRAVDTATHPGVRRLGIFSRLTQRSLEQARADGVHLIFNTPNPQSMAGYLKLGWTLVGRPRLMLRPLNLARIAEVRLLRRRDGGRTPAEVTFRETPPPVEELLARPDLDLLLAEDDRLRAGELRTERTPVFLRWRYALPPSLRYAAVAAGEGEGAAAAVFRANVRDGLREIMLTELLAGARAADTVRVVMRQVAGMVRADYIVAAAAPGSPHWRMLRGAGFLPLPKGAGPNFTVHPLNWPAGTPDPAHLDAWRFSLGDLEIF